jgi:hypothetical protein
MMIPKKRQTCRIPSRNSLPENKTKNATVPPDFNYGAMAAPMCGAYAVSIDIGHKIPASNANTK